MKGQQKHLDLVLSEYDLIRPRIESRMDDFRDVWKRRDSVEVLQELFFCILTPQSRAQTCWGAVEELVCRDLLLEGSFEDVLEVVGIVRFKYRKASYILEARGKFIEDGRITLVDRLEEKEEPGSIRDYLISEVKGFGYKESSHFLRNIGLGEEIAILDRHILKNLLLLGVIDGIPASMTPRRYLDIEKDLLGFSKEIGIPPAHLDLLLWYMEAGTIFK